MIGDKSSGKKGSERIDSPSPASAAGGGAGGADAANTLPNAVHTTSKQQTEQLSRNTQNNASQDNARTRRKGYVGLNGGPDDDGRAVTEAGGGGGGSVGQGQGQAKGPGLGSSINNQSTNHSINQSNKSWKSNPSQQASPHRSSRRSHNSHNSPPHQDISPVDLSVLLSTNLQARLAPRGPMVHDSVTWGTSLALCLLFLITAIPAPLVLYLPHPHPGYYLLNV